MRFYTVLFAVIFLVSKPYAAYFENADALVSETAERLHVRLSPLVLPCGAKMAENITQVSRVSGIGVESVAGVLFVPHHHVFSSVEFLIIPVFTESISSVLASHFFPTREAEMLPNTVAVNDPIGKLNQVNQKGLREKMEAVRRLGAFARLIQDAFETTPSIDKLIDQLLQAWGVGNPSQTKTFQEVSLEGFATQELMAAILKGQALAQGLIEAYKRGEGEHDETGEDIEDPMLLSFQEAMTDPQPRTAVARLSFPSLFDQGLLKEGDLEVLEARGGMPFSEKNLMLLRKRHVAYLIAQQIRQEQAEGGRAETSSALAQVMTFFWKTASTEGLTPFYEGFFKQELGMDKADLKTLWDRQALSRLLDQVKGDPASFWALPPHQQSHLLHLDLSLKTFKLPTSGMAEPIPGKGSYSDCVESTARGGFLDLLRNPITGDMEAHLLPEGPFKDYFVEFSNERGRLSPEGRNKWAAETWKVPGTRRVKDKFGFIPSLENILLTLQTMMGDQELVVQPITTETTIEEISERYRALLVRANAWFSAHLKRPVELSLDEDGVRLLREENRTVGLINLKAQKKDGAPLSEIGSMNIMGHHGDYNHNQALFDDLSPRASGGADSVTSHLPQPKEDTRPLVERVSEVASNEEQLAQLVPWATPTLMDRLPTSEVEQRAAKTIIARLGATFPLFDFETYPELYISCLKAAIVYGSSQDLTSVLKAGILMDLSNNKSEATLMIQRLMDDPETASKVSPEILREMVRRSPELLEIQAPSDPEKNFQPAHSFLERFLEGGETDILRRVGRKVSRIPFDFMGDKMKQRPDAFWENLAIVTDAFPLLREISFMNNLYIMQLWSDAEKRALQDHLPIFKRFSVREIGFTTLTPELLEFFLPVISEHTKNIQYWYSSADWQASDVKKREEDQALRAKFAELQQAGLLPQTVTLKAQGELAALSRTK